MTRLTTAIDSLDGRCENALVFRSDSPARYAHLELQQAAIRGAGSLATEFGSFAKHQTS
jgi:hypothetical protein